MNQSSTIFLITILPLSGCVADGGPHVEAKQTKPVTAEQVVARHIEATGGNQNHAALQNIVIETDVIEPSFSVSGPYHANRDGRMRVDIFMDGKRVFSEGIDERGGWQQGGEGAAFKEIGADGYAALHRGVIQNLHGFFGATDRGQKITLAGREIIDGVDYFILRSIDADGFEQNYFINPESWLIERRRETSALHPDIDPTKNASEKTYSDFREFCGLKKPTRSRTVDLRTGEETQRTQILKYRCNVPENELRLSRDDPPEPD